MKRYCLNTEIELASLPAFRAAEALELRLLCLMLASPDATFSQEELAARLSVSAEETMCALAFWHGAGVIAPSTADKPAASEPSATPTPQKKPLRSEDRLPTYSAATRAEIISEKSLASFIEVCQETYGKVFSDMDVNIVIGLHEHLALETDTICLLIAFCTEHGHKPMRYIEKVAFSLYEQGITTTEALTAYIEKKHRTESREGHLRRLFGIGDRALSSKEEAAFMRWCEEYGYDDAVIGIAFDMTVNKTGKASIPYADKLISGWNTAGCKTAADVEAHLEQESKSRPQAATGKSKSAGKKVAQSFDIDDFFAAALERSYGEPQ